MFTACPNCTEAQDGCAIHPEDQSTAGRVRHYTLWWAILVLFAGNLASLKLVIWFARARLDVNSFTVYGQTFSYAAANLVLSFVYVSLIVLLFCLEIGRYRRRVLRLLDVQRRRDHGDAA